MATWRDLEMEVEAWAEAGKKARLWWRDDDASGVTPDLTRMLDLHNEYMVPLVVASVPGALSAELPDKLNSAPGITVVQHGFLHKNRALEGERASEYPGSRNTREMIDEVNDGWTRMSAFRYREKGFVPPWNRISAAFTGVLHDLGYGVVSTFAPREQGDRGSVNSHVDIINWRDGRRFRGTEKVLGQTVGHLRAKRLGECDADEPTGILSHHLAHDEGCWTFLEELMGWTRKRDDVEWLPGSRIFA